MGSCPGGVADQAIAAARLGLRPGWRPRSAMTATATTTGRSWPRRSSGPVPVPAGGGLAFTGDGVPKRGPRPVHGDARPCGPGDLQRTDRLPPPALAAVAELGEELEPWALDAYKTGVRLFGDVGWIPPASSSARLDNLRYFHAFMPNQHEAMAFTGHDNPWAALYSLADRVPVAVVTLRAQGPWPWTPTGEEEWVPSLPVSAYDPTGAGDCFGPPLLSGAWRGGRSATGCGSPTCARHWPCRRWAARWQPRLG